MEVDDCSKLYCKIKNLLKVTLEDIEYSFEGEFL
jgi:hypothetical protein